MKKLISIALTLIFSMAIFTGCTKGNDENKPSSDPTPTPKPTPVVNQTQQDEEQNNEYTYETVLMLWEDMDGYWARHDGGYMEFTTDEEGKAVTVSYDRFDDIIAVIYPETVMASNKTTYIVEVKYPAINSSEKYPGFTQKESEAAFTMEIAGFGDGFVEIVDDAGNIQPYVSVGDSLEYLIDGVEKAEELIK